jgi:CheY-like chemotaxis protein
MEVADSGIGIKEEDLAELFSSFTRFDRELNQDVEGTGLGLAITKRLTEAMGGEIAVSSLYGVGSVFTVTIPQKVVSLALVGEGQMGGSERRVAANDLSVHFVAPEARILIVDDIRTNLKVGQGLLAPYEASVELCDQAREAPALVERGSYDLIFLDHMMPGLTGVEVAAKIRAMEAAGRPRTPLVALTGDAGPEMTRMFLARGFDDVLAKPVELARLGENMDRWIPEALRQDPSRRRRGPADSLPLPAPEGLDVREGLARSGGKPAYYLEVLGCFRADALERLETLKTPPTLERLPALAGSLHALKSAAGGVGAGALADRAGRLEAAARRGDLAQVESALSPFVASLEELLAGIKAYAAECAKGLADPEAVLDPGALQDLIEALKAEDIKKIDEILEAMPLAASDSPAGALIAEVSEAVLRLEMPKAVELIERHLAEHFS